MVEVGMSIALLRSLSGSCRAHQIDVTGRPKTKRINAVRKKSKKAPDLVGRSATCPTEPANRSGACSLRDDRQRPAHLRDRIDPALHAAMWREHRLGTARPSPPQRRRLFPNELHD